MFLETFRLPGESAEIALVMQHFSEEWFRANNEPFFHVDAAFTLSYAIIMLNVDQHNPQVEHFVEEKLKIWMKIDFSAGFFEKKKPKI